MKDWLIYKGAEFFFPMQCTKIQVSDQSAPILMLIFSMECG